MEDIQYTIGQNFLRDLDGFIHKEWLKLTCDDIHKIYSDFIFELKKYKGNSNGFHGLSEFLIFRYLFHKLGGEFGVNKISKDLCDFISKSEKNLRIGQSIPVHSYNKRHYPGIVIFDSDKLKSVIQIKIYITGGINEINHEINSLENIKQKYPDMRALLVIFNNISYLGTPVPYLENMRLEKKWFNYVILEGNLSYFGEVLDTVIKQIND